MAAVDIQARIKRGLARAAVRAGGVGAPLVYLQKETISGGTSPIDPPLVTITPVLLPNAVFSTISNALIDGTIIKQGDVSFVADSDEPLTQGDVIKRGDDSYIVITADPVSPFGISLANKTIMRKK